MAKRLIQTYSNPSTDTVSYTYTGAGRGKVNLVAEVDIDESTVVSQPYEVLDATFYDKGLSGDGNHNDNWSQYTTATYDRKAEYTEIASQSDTLFGVLEITDGSVIEFDYYCTNTSENGISIRQNATAVWQRTLTQLGVSANTWCHVKIKLDNGEFWLWVDGVDKTPTTHTISTFNRFFFRVTSSYSVRFREFVVYPI